MTRSLFLLAALLGGTLIASAGPAAAQSVGYVTGIPGRDPAGDDEFGWGPAYRPETTFAQPGTPPTPGQLAARGYYQRTGRTVYPPVGYYDPQAVAPGYYPAPPRRIRRAQAVRPTYDRRRSGKAYRRVVVRERGRPY